MSSRGDLDDIALDRAAVDYDRADPALPSLRVADDDFELGSPEAPHDSIPRERCGDAGVYLQPLESRPDAEDILGYRIPVPCGRARQPGVLALSGLRSILARDHLAIDIGLDPVQSLVSDPRRAYFRIVRPRIVAASGHRLRDNHPRIVVAEDAGVLLVTGRIGGYLAQIPRDSSYRPAN